MQGSGPAWDLGLALPVSFWRPQTGGPGASSLTSKTSGEKEEAFCLRIRDKAEEMLNPEEGSGASSGPEQGGQQQLGHLQGAPQPSPEHSPISQDKSELSQPQGPLPAAVTPQPQTKQLEPAGAAEAGARWVWLEQDPVGGGTLSLREAVLEP